jgi:hypothetical protein
MKTNKITKINFTITNYIIQKILNSKFHTSSILKSSFNKINVKKDVWLKEVYKLKNSLLTEEQIKDKLSIFFIYLKKTNITQNNYIFIMVKLKTLENEYKTLSYIQKFTNREYNEVFEAIMKFYYKKAEYYEWTNITHIIVQYKICSKGTVIEKSKIVEPIETIKELEGKSILNFINYSGIKLANTMDYNLWGKVTHQSENMIIVKKHNSDSEFIINTNKKLDNNNIEYYSNDVVLRLDDLILVSFTDILNKDSNSLDTFSRYIKVKNSKDQEYIFKNGNLVFKKIPKTVKYLKPLLKDKKINNKIIVMDVETRDIGDRKRVYCISIFDGSKIKNLFLSDYNNEKDLLESSIKYLLREKYNKHKVYFHNFSKFDSAFFIKTLSILSNKTLKPITRNDKIIELKFYYGSNYYIVFRDSLLLLPAKLSKLAKSFGFEDKGVFPYDFVNNKHINLDYNGKFPRFHFFPWEKFSDSQEILDYRNNYFEYKKLFKYKKWNLRDESIKYCENDVRILYNVLIKFNKIIFEKFNVDGLKYPTLSSLSFAIYRTNYLRSLTIPLITGNLYKALKLSYTGGSVDVYRSYGENINGYDVNSLYPSVMRNNDMPVGNPIFFEGDVYEYEKDPFGFFEVEVNCPLDLNVPMLQIRIKTSKGFRTITPVGTWTWGYFSEEIKGAIKLGCTFKVLRGFLFERQNIFKDFVTDINKYKENSERNSAEYIIFKMIQNSIYGRFGMKPEIENSLIVSDKEFDELISNDYIIPIKYYDLDENNKKFITFYDLRDTNLLNFTREMNVSVSIASAITAYARIFMSYYKNLPDITLFYSDTDSIYCKGNLDEKYISEKELGKFKLEKKLTKGIFLTAKMYGGKYLDKNNKIKDFCKIKGLNQKVEFIRLLPLLFKNKHIKFEQEKWYRDISDSSIIKKNFEHKLELSSFKRRIIYDENNKFIETKPIILKNSEIVEV